MVLAKMRKQYLFQVSLGFTLIELLIAVSIMGILAALVLAALNPFQQFKKAHDAQRKSDLRQIKLALEQYYNDNGKYPQVGTCAYGTNGYVYSLSGGICGGTGGSNWISSLVPTYIAKLPVDPINNAIQPWNAGNYSYAYGNVSSDGQHYDLFTQLEATSDPQRCGVQDYLYIIGLSPPGSHWCTAFGGAYSNQIYALDQ